jgi:pimeloyl-ACP methyl ester carboxylesterase
MCQFNMGGFWIAMNLPPGMTSRIVPGVNGLDMHVLETGELGNPALLLLHGYPELAVSWLKVMPPLTAAGYRVIAPALRMSGIGDGRLSLLNTHDLLERQI